MTVPTKMLQTAAVQPLRIHDEIEAIMCAYNMRAVGSAAIELLDHNNTQSAAVAHVPSTTHPFS